MEIPGLLHLIIPVLVVGGARSTEIGTGAGAQCFTLETRSPCVLPFEHNGTVSSTCVTLGEPLGRPRCPTSAPPNSWEHCAPGCPLPRGCPSGWTRLDRGCVQIFRVSGGTSQQQARAICRQYGAKLPRVDASMEGAGLRDTLTDFYWSKVTSKGCYGGEALWLAGPEGQDSCRAWLADGHVAREVTRGFPVASLDCSNRTVEVWQQHVNVQVLCMVEDELDQEDQAGGMVKSIFSAVLSNLMTVSSSLWGGQRDGQGWRKGAVCPPGFSELPAGCFLFGSSETATGEEAREVCRARGAELAELQGEEEVEEVREYWGRQRPGCREEAWWWLEPRSRNCTGQVAVELASREELCEERDRARVKAGSRGYSTLKLRPLCWVDRLTEGQLKTQRFQTFLQGLGRLVRRPAQGQEEEEE